MIGVIPICPFPPLHWWYLATNGAVLDAAATFQKQSFQNRIQLATSHGAETITFGIRGGTQAHPMISHHAPPVQSWRAMQSAYGKSPFFEFFADELHAHWMTLPHAESDQMALRDWSQFTIDWISRTCGWNLPSPEKHPLPVTNSPNDLRNKKALNGAGWEFHRYPQLFESKVGFVPKCSILDALFILGPKELNNQLNQLVSLSRT